MADANLEILINAKNEAEKTLKELLGSIRDIDRELRGVDPDNLSDLDTASRKASEGMDDLEGSARDAEDAVDDLGNSDGFDDLTEGAEDAQGEMEDLSESIDDVKEATVLLAAAGTAVVAFFGFAAKGAAEFRAQVAEITTLIDTSVISHQELAAAVLEVNTAFGTSKASTAKALYDIISSGAEAGEEANKLLASSAKLATAGVTDIGVAADGLTTIMNAFGDAVGGAEEISDKLFKTVEGGKTTVEELSGFMFQAAPIAATLGISLDEVLASMASLTKQGTPTSQSFTQVRALLVSLAKPLPELAEAFQTYAGASAEAVLANEGLGAAIRVVEEASGGSKSAMVQLLGSVESFNALASLSTDNSRFFNEALVSIGDSAGAVDTAVAKIQAGPLQKMAIAGEQLSAAFVTIGELVLPALSDIVEVLGDVADGVRAFIEDNQTLSKVLGYTVATLGGLLVVLGTVALAVGVLTKAKAGLSGAITLVNTTLGIQNGMLARNAAASGTAAAATRGAAAAQITLAGSLSTMLAAATRLVPVLSALYAAYLGFKAFDLYQEDEAQMRKLEADVRKTKDVMLSFADTQKATNEAIETENREHLDNLNRDLRARLAQIQEARTSFAMADDRLEILGFTIGDAPDPAVIAELDAQYNSVFQTLKKLVETRNRLNEESEAANEQDGLIEPLTLTKDLVGLVASQMRELNDVKFGNVTRQIEAMGVELAALREMGGSDESILELERRITEATIDLAKRRADSTTAIAEQEALELRRIAENTITDEKKKSEALRGIALDLAKDRLAIQKSLEADLQANLDNALASQRRAAAEALDLAKGIIDERKAGAEQLRDIQGKELSEYQQYVALQKEISEARKDASKAEETGDLDALEEAGRRQRELANQIAELESVKFDSGREYLNQEETVAQATRVSEEATRNIVGALEKRKKLAEDLEKSSKGEAETLRDSLAGIRTEITALSEESVSIPLEADTSKLDKIFDDVEDSLGKRDFSVRLRIDDLDADAEELFDKLGQEKTFTITPRSQELDDKLAEINTELSKEYEVRIKYNEVNRPQGFKAGGSVQIAGYAGGGMIKGPGTPTSDSILIAASRDEFMMRNAAVKKYGTDFMDAVNTLKYPKTQGFATGGSIGKGPSAMGTGSSSSGTPGTDTVNLNLDLGAGPTKLFGDREDVRRLASSLKWLKRGS